MSSLPSSILSTIESLFMGRTNFVVPRYQREYSWSKSNVETLITDLKKVFESNDGSEAHIMGLLVLCQRPDSQRNFEVVDIIDGQQRLTTILIMLSWIRDRLHDLQANYSEWEKHAENRAWSNLSFKIDLIIKNEVGPRFSTDNEAIFELEFLEIALLQINDLQTSNRKLTPEVKEAINKKYTETPAAERNLPQLKIHLFHNNLLFNQTKAKAKNVVKNYKYINESLSKFIENKNLSDAANQLYKLGFRIIQNIKFVPLVVDDYNQAFRLFETMNDRGLSVSALDLIKNEALQHGGTEERNKIHALWNEVFVSNFPENKVNPLKFLRYAHNARHEFVQMSGLFSSYKNDIFKGSYDKVVTELNALNELAPFYNQFFDGSHSDFPLRNAIVRLVTTKVEQWQTLGMVAFHLSMQRPELVEAITSTLLKTHTLIFISTLRGKSPAAYEQKFPKWAGQLWDNRSMSDSALHNILIEVSDEIWDLSQEDGVLSIDELANKKVFNNNAGLNACITVLLKRHPHGHDFNIDWTLEHIFPQNPRPEDWSHFEISDTDDSVNRLCYSFGNFILLKKGLNSKASNSSFQKKKLLYVERHVEDQFSRIEPRLSVQSCDEWTPEIINERNAKMSEELYHELIGIHL